MALMAIFFVPGNDLRVVTTDSEGLTALHFSTMRCVREAIPEEYSKRFKATFHPACSACAVPSAARNSIPADNFVPDGIQDMRDAPLFCNTLTASSVQQRVVSSRVEKIMRPESVPIPSRWVVR